MLYWSIILEENTGRLDDITGLDGTYHGKKRGQENTEKIVIVQNIYEGQTWIGKTSKLDWSIIGSETRRLSE